MTKEQQREAARRILEKSPLTDEEREIVAYNPSPKEWTEAYNKIQDAKEKVKEKPKD